MTKRIIGSLVLGAMLAAGCATLPSSQELDQQAQAAIKASFRDEGIAKVDRINQDLGQAALVEFRIGRGGHASISLSCSIAPFVTSTFL